MGDEGVTDQQALSQSGTGRPNQWNATFTAAEFMEYADHKFAVMTMRFDRYQVKGKKGKWDLLALCTGATEDGEWKITCADTTDNDYKFFRCLDENTMVMETLESLVPTAETQDQSQSNGNCLGW